MNTFEKNVISIYREEGRGWLNRLPEEVHRLKRLWNLSHLRPLNHLSYNYVLSGFQEELPVILKLSLNTKDLQREAAALDVFKGFGAVSVLNREQNALLLQQLFPGCSLKSTSFGQNKKNIEIACNVARKLHQSPLINGADFPHIIDWLATLDKDWEIPNSYLQKARTLKKQLLAEISVMPVLLHGDLHQDNILSHGDNWVAIDPKGVVGFPINEMWACVEKPSHDLKYIAEYFEYTFDDVIKWYYVHLVLAACWQVEDNLDPTLFLNLAHSILPQITK